MPKEDLKLITFFKAFGLINILKARSFKLTILLSSIISLIISYNYYISDKLFYEKENTILELSEIICNNVITINSSLLGIIIASMAIYASVLNIKLLSKLYESEINKRYPYTKLHSYVFVLFYPTFPAVLGLIFAIFGYVLIEFEIFWSIVIAILSLFFAFLCLFSVLELILQIAGYVISAAKNESDNK